MNCEELKEVVGRQLENSFVSRMEGDDCLLITPFLTADIAPVEVWLHSSTGTITVSDEGEAVNQLFTSGVDVFSSKPLSATAELISRQFQVRFEDGAYFAQATQETLGEVVNRVAQASQAASYLVYKRSGRPKSRFDDTVEKALIDHSIAYSAKYTLRGQASTQVVPFFVNSNKNVLLQPLSALTVESARSKAQRVAYKWLDLQRRYGDQYRYSVLLDDTSEQKGIVWEDNEAISPLQVYSTRVYQYSTEMPILIQMLQ